MLNKILMSKYIKIITTKTIKLIEKYKFNNINNMIKHKIP